MKKKLSRSDCERDFNKCYMPGPVNNGILKTLAKKLTEISLFSHIRFDHFELQFFCSDLLNIQKRS